MVTDSNNTSEEEGEPGFQLMLMYSAFLFVHRGTTSKDESLKKIDHLYTLGS